MINSTLKMVMFRITEIYKDKLDLMYGINASEVSVKENIKVLKELISFT